MRAFAQFMVKAPRRISHSRRMIASVKCRLPHELPAPLLLPVGGTCIGALALISHYALVATDELRKKATVKIHPSTSLVCGSLVFNFSNTNK